MGPKQHSITNFNIITIISTLKYYHIRAVSAENTAASIHLLHHLKVSAIQGQNGTRVCIFMRRKPSGGIAVRDVLREEEQGVSWRDLGSPWFFCGIILLALSVANNNWRLPGHLNVWCWATFCKYREKLLLPGQSIRRQDGKFLITPFKRCSTLFISVFIGDHATEGTCSDMFMNVWPASFNVYISMFA